MVAGMFEHEPASTPAERPRSLGAAGDDDRAVEVCNVEGRAPVLLLCDHAGGWVPPELGDLGLPPQELVRHIGWDIGAADLTRCLARLLDAPAVLCHVSRLVIDPNRQPGDPSSIPAISDGTLVPGNQDLSADEVRRRVRRFFIPYHRAIARRIARLRRRHGIPAIVSIHSFTPRMAHTWRPWHVAVLWDRDQRLAAPVLAGLRRDLELRVGDNEPYSGRFPVGYSIPFHAVRPRLPHVAFEVRQDLIDTPAAAETWAERLAEVLRPPLSDRTLYSLHEC
jgi:predicted N-formylglutamate amidohydrolase